MKYEIGTADSFRAKFTVRRNGAIFPVVGATVVALATNGTTVITGTVDMAEAADGKIGVMFAAGAFSVGDWEVQVRVTIGSETQTVARAFFRAVQSVIAA